jgi:hypothetical protein
MSYRQIERDLGISMGSVAVTLGGTQVRAGKIDEWTPASGRLSAEEREDILVGLSHGCRRSLASSAELLRLSLGRSRPTVESPNTGPGERIAELERAFDDRSGQSWITLGS